MGIFHKGDRVRVKTCNHSTVSDGMLPTIGRVGSIWRTDLDGEFFSINFDDENDPDSILFDYSFHISDLDFEDTTTIFDT